jgi:spermidine synthase
MFPRCKSGNTIAFAATGEAINIALPDLKDRSLRLEERTGLMLMSILCKLDQEPTCPEGVLRI